MNRNLDADRAGLRHARAWRRPRGKSSVAALLAALLLTGPVQAGSVTYTYDALGRLASATYSNGVVITYTYDAAGNRSSQVTTGVP